MATYSKFLQDQLDVYDAFVPNPPNALSDILPITEAWTYELYHQFADQLVPLNYFFGSVSASRTLEDLLDVTSVFTASVESLNYVVTTIPPQNLPIPNNGSGTTHPSPMVLGPFGDAQNKYAERQVSFSGQDGSIVIKAPEFGDSDAYSAKNINEYTRGLALILYRDPIWGFEQTFDIAFALVDDKVIDSIRSFLRATVGQVITYTDIFGNDSIGFITNPEAEAVGDQIGWSIKFNFLKATPA